MEMIVLEWSVFIIPSYILCSDRIYHFREIFNVTFGVPNTMEAFFLAVEGEIYAICLASNLPNNS